MTAFVLIHSTGQSAAGWQRVSDALRDRGAVAHTIDLPNSEAMLSADFAKLVGGAFADVDSPVVVAHSGSGPLLPSLAQVLNARLQVWLAAWVPDGQQSFAADVQAHKDVAFNPGWIGKDPISDADAAQAYLYHDCDAQTLQWALTTRREFYPAGVYGEVIARHDDVPSVYILATRDRAIVPSWQERMARERLRVAPIEVDSGHCPNVSKPEELAEILVTSSASIGLAAGRAVLCPPSLSGG